MQPTFTITNSLTTLTLDKGQGELLFTVTNTTNGNVRGRADVELDLREGVQVDWFEIEAPRIRTFGAHETAIVRVRSEVPPEQPDVQPRLSLSVANVERPQEDYHISSPVVLRGLAWKPEVRRLPWYRRRVWIVVLLALLLVGGVSAGAYWFFQPRLTGLSLIEALAKVHAKDWDLAEVTWDFDETIKDRMIKLSGTVLDYSMADTEIRITIQHWHPYTTPESLGTNSGQRLKRVQKYSQGVFKDSAMAYSLENWIGKEDQKAVAELESAGAPLKAWVNKKKYPVKCALAPAAK